MSREESLLGSYMKNVIVDVERLFGDRRLKRPIDR